jgi:hypothetical protein
MNRFLSIYLLVIFPGALFLVCSLQNASAQSINDLIGTWEPVSIVNTSRAGVKSEPFGPTPKGIIFFGANGRFAQIENRPGIPKFSSDNRMQGTPEENKAIVQNTIAYFGTYTVADKTLIMHIEGGSWSGWIGSYQKRPIISFVGDQITLAIASTGGGMNESIFRRLK